MGSIFFGIALSLQALTGYPMSAIMIMMGVCIILYTVFGGMKAVIWTEVVQAVIKTGGAFLILYLLIDGMPGGMSGIVDIGKENEKFSLGSFSPGFTQSTFWVVLLYGFFINLNNFGMDQNYVQRYHTAINAKQASKSIWLCVFLYVPVSLLFFVIGSSLFAYYQQQPELLDAVRYQAAAERLGVLASPTDITNLAATLQPADYGDKVMPHFIVNKVPQGLTGLIISALLAAAMSTISSSMNASATVFTADIYERYFRPGITDKIKLRILHIGTVIFGLLGMCTGIAMIGAKKFAGYMVGAIRHFCRRYVGIVLTGHHQPAGKKRCCAYSLHYRYTGNSLDDLFQKIAWLVFILKKSDA